MNKLKISLWMALMLAVAGTAIAQDDTTMDDEAGGEEDMGDAPWNQTGEEDEEPTMGEEPPLGGEEGQPEEAGAPEQDTPGFTLLAGVGALAVLAIVAGRRRR